MANIHKGTLFAIAIVVVLTVVAGRFLVPKTPARDSTTNRQAAPSPDEPVPSSNQSSNAVGALTAAAKEPAEPSDPPTVGNDQPPTSESDSVTPDPTPVPVDLTRFYRLRSSSFDQVTTFPWKAVPRGLQTFANVPLQLDGALFLWGERNAKMGLTYPEQVEGIPIMQAFETLYIYHAAFFEGEPGVPVYDIKFQYADGTSATDRILCGDDVRDWFGKPGETMIGPTSDRSTLAWNGTDENGRLLRFCLTAVANPHPSVDVMSLDLISCKTPTAGCIMGMTLGKPGLLIKPSEPEPTDGR